MTSRPIALAATALALLWSSHASAQCTKDTDCRGDRICQQGTCVSPAPPPPNVSAPAPGPAAAPVEMGSRRLAVKVHPLTLVGGLILGATTGITVLSLPVELEYALAPNFSIFAQGSPVVVSGALGTFPGLLLGGGARFYPLSQALNGPWVGGMLAGGVSAGGFSGDLQIQAGWAFAFDFGLYLSVGAALSFSGLVAGGIPVGLLVPVGLTF